MIQASRTLSARPLHQPTLSPALVRRRKPLMLAPPSAYLRMPVQIAEPEETASWPTWREDMRFFFGCYVAGVVFFLIMLS
jgi:hypothetical protein